MKSRTVIITKSSCALARVLVPVKPAVNEKNVVFPFSKEVYERTKVWSVMVRRIGTQNVWGRFQFKIEGDPSRDGRPRAILDSERGEERAAFTARVFIPFP